MAITTNRIAGEVQLTVDGDAFLLRGDFQYSTQSVTRKSLPGQDRIHGYSEMPKVPFIEGTITDTAGKSLDDLVNMSSVTIRALLANGKTVVGSNMWVVDDVTSETTEGTIKIRWEGLSGSVTDTN